MHMDPEEPRLNAREKVKTDLSGGSDTEYSIERKGCTRNIFRCVGMKDFKLF
jgi:hypothetical protein